MQCLEYPFDGNYIIAKKKKLKRELMEERNDFVDKKIAILGGSTTNDIRLTLELFLLNHGIRPSFYESEYAQYYEDAVFPNPTLLAFQPDVIYIHTTNRNITTYPMLSDDTDTIDSLIDAEYRKFCGVWENLERTYHCPIIQNNFEMPYYRLLGNKEASDPHGRVNFLTRLNMKFYAYAQEHENFYICDINYISADYGLKEWSDPFYYYMYKYALSVPAIPYLTYNVAAMIKSLFGKNKKGLVLDLDQTLWGGIIGDDGVENIVLGPEEAEGQAYSEFQEYLKAQKQLGVLLNIDSKNDRENALAGLRHPDSAFTEEDFLFIQANWEPKDQNFRVIAEGLNLLPESLVFVDDNPAERHIVREQLPGVSAPELGQVQEYIGILDRSHFFETTILSEDDKKRNEMYLENAKRKAFEEHFSDYREYLLSLQMHAVIRPFEPLYMARIAQLTNKSNQFNLTTKRYTQTEIEEVSRDKTCITLYGKLSDRFGDNGVVSVVIGRIEEEACHIELWLMSCRVLKRDMEFAMMDRLVRICQSRGIRRLMGYYYPTAKNKMVRDFYELQGFRKDREEADGSKVYSFAVTDQYTEKNTVIQVEESNEQG